MFGKIDIGVSQEPPRMIFGEFLHNIQLFWQFLYDHMYISVELPKFHDSILAARRYINQAIQELGEIIFHHIDVNEHLPLATSLGVYV